MKYRRKDDCKELQQTVDLSLRHTDNISTQRKLWSLNVLIHTSAFRYYIGESAFMVTRAGRMDYYHRSQKMHWLWVGPPIRRKPFAPMVMPLYGTDDFGNLFMVGDTSENR